MASGNLLAKLSLISVSIAVSVLFVEIALRLIFNPVNFLSPVIVTDEILGYRVEPGSAAHDDWGFRNEAVPDRAAIVAIGDSQTYGVSANAYNSWPAWLSRFTEKQVYNLALGGYGPIQYEFLLENRAFGLDPSIVVVGFYMGNDLLDSYKTVYGLEHWEHLRRPGVPLTEPVSVKSDKGRGSIAAIRLWLGRNSVLYRMIGRSLGQAVRTLIANESEVADGVVRISDADLSTAFTPTMRLDALDRSKPEVREGLRLAMEALVRIKKKCDAAGVQLIVLIVPTKEAVFSERLFGRRDLDHTEDIDALIEYEALTRRELISFLEGENIRVVDPIAHLRHAATEAPIYPGNEGGHPVSFGYRAIASAVDEEISEMQEAANRQESVSR